MLVQNKGWSRESSPFHDGEQAIQERVGKRDKMERLARKVIRDYMPPATSRVLSTAAFSIGRQRRLRGLAVGVICSWGNRLYTEPGRTPAAAQYRPPDG